MPGGPSRHAADAEAGGAAVVDVNPLLMGRLRDLSDRLLGANPRASRRAARRRLVLVEDAVPYAYADLEGDAVIVSYGMVRGLDDDELLVVLGHEEAHFAARDDAPRGPVGWLRRSLVTWLGRFALNYKVAGWVARGLWKAGAGRWTAAAVTVAAVCAARLAYATLDRWSAEWRADYVGWRMAVAAGARPSAARTLFERPAVRRADGARARFPRLTHPPVAWRAWLMRLFEAASEWAGGWRRTARHRRRGGPRG